MFVGEYQHTLDAKGRLSLPARFREQLPGSLMIAKGMDGNLYVRSMDDYAEFLGRMMGKDDFDPDLRAARSFFAAGAVETQLDSAGRISVPGHLREYARLDKDVAVIGNGDRIEIWDAKKWAAANSETAEHIAEITKALSERGIL